MLEQLRKGSSNIFVKALLFLVVLSFIIWGVGDMFGNSTGNSIATIGNESISQQEFNQTFRQEVRRIQSMTGGAITSEQIAAMQVDRMVLHQMVNAKLLQMEAKSLGIHISTDVVLDQIINDPNFKNEEGNFDKERFQLLLRSNNLTEKKFLDMLKTGMASDLLVDALTTSSFQPDAIVNAIYAYRNEQRKIDLITIFKENITLDSLPSPTEAELMKYYEAHKDGYAVPEYRDVSYVTLKTDDVIAQIQIDDATLKQLYEEQKDLYQLPERREVDNMLFSSEEEAKAAWERLNKQEDFYAIAKELTGQEQKDVDMGLVSKDSIPEIANTVFALSQGAYSSPVKGPFGWHILRVRSIKPESTKDFEEVRDQVLMQAQSDQSSEALEQRVNEIEDAFASGSTLEEVAQAYHMDIKTIHAINRDGKNAHGKEVQALPGGNEYFLKLVFDTNREEVSPLTITPDNTKYVAVRVDAITEPRIKALDEVKGSVQEAWKQQRQMSALQELAHKLANDLKKGTPLQEAASGLKIQIDSGKVVGRDGDGDIALSPTMQEAVFITKTGNYTSAYPNGPSYNLALVRESIPAEKNQAKLNKIKGEIATGAANDLFSQYNLYLQKRYPVSVNEGLLKQAEQQ